ncbi:MAG: (d)CMP kinase [Paramuribaculum sp.]|nr:(d)CMP kinase [Paramuribaculum sp.]
MTADKNKIIVAIDGYSSSGKSTMAKKLAADLGYRYIDSGAMYRAVTLFAMEHGMISESGSVDETALTDALRNIHIDFAVTPEGQHTILNGVDVEHLIRSLEVSNHVSPVAAIHSVRLALTAQQQRFGAEKGIVMDGRDIGTTVFPNAEMKVFVTASPEKRARRRFIELQQNGTPSSYEDVLANVIERDHIDETRKESPLRKADDSVILDNSDMSLQQQEKWLMDLYNRITSEINGSNC